jgi:Family of unknown function (DUF6551)
VSTQTSRVMEPAVARLPDLEAKRAHAEWPFEVGLVPLRVLVVDDTYQRPPHHEFILREAARFDPTLVGTIDLSVRKNGSYAILDGQQRYLIMMQVGKTACYASIYTGMSVRDEAGFFFKKNKDRNAMKPYYSFRARRVAGDQQAADIVKLVEAEGFTLGPASNDEDVIGAVNAVETVYEYTSEAREQCLSNTLYTIREAFKGRRECFHSSLMLGIGRFWQAYADDEVHFDRLVQGLQEHGPTGLLGLARDAVAVAPRGMGGSQGLPKHVARQMVMIHNKQLGQGTGRSGAGRKGRLDTRKVGF